MHTNSPATTPHQPDLSLDDEIESHIDHGQVQVEPGDADNEARELPFCACEPEAAT